MLGKPKSAEMEEDTGLPIVTFAVSDPVRGTLVVRIQHGLVKSMSLYPEETTLTKERIIQILGSGYLTVHYSYDECLDAGGATPVYEDPTGEIERIEYRSRGVSVSFHDNNVDEILFVAKPLGPTHSRCPPEGGKE